MSSEIPPSFRDARPRFPRRTMWLAAVVFALLFISIGVSILNRPGIQPLQTEIGNRPAAAEREMEIVPAGKELPRSSEPERADRIGVDASNYYKNAFVLYNRLTDEEKKVLSQPLAATDPDTAEALFKNIQPIMDLLREAMKADYCDWGLGPITFDTALPHLGKAMDLGKLALWNAAFRVASEPSGAIDDLSARARLGHNIADTLIGTLIEMKFEKSATGFIRENASALDADALGKVAALLNDSPVADDLVKAFDTEVAGVEAIGKKLAAQSADERMKMMAGILYGLAVTSKSDAGLAQASRLEAIFRDPGQLAAEIQFTTDIERQMAKAMLLPEAGFQAWYQGLQTALPDHPLAASTILSTVGVQARLQQSRIERAMLGVGLDVLQNGPSRVSGVLDPVTGKPFAYVPTADGFELRSTYGVKGKPLTMSFTLPK